MNISKYLTDVRKEMNHVTWPSRTEALTYTGIVVVLSVVVALFAAFVDFGMLELIKSLTR
ncbi:preprotein translocase subunit SecE [Candidatus Kaiserbacteria bacterium RIFCSPHIGHO2_02_FULL_49_34]|uniref:Protein translocase subunit SecE n=1 Tax=Candidatus Kaiserbacteria bacterium RIFCSPHIGHO2_02_FULL_49_34 TaxID=1798491 RepID=A0A1F6DKD3_9BACT|nr:MAG: preprotein translocase subunit SecE [Candidatus Kaiserbacteria bacterium RIFCSPHIGHO2_02_FULL_49_34]